MAATFVNLEAGRSVRITAGEEARRRAKTLCPEIEDKYKQQVQAYQIMPEDELFKVEEVEVFMTCRAGRKGEFPAPSAVIMCRIIEK